MCYNVLKNMIIYIDATFSTIVHNCAYVFEFYYNNK